MEEKEIKDIQLKYKDKTLKDIFLIGRNEVKNYAKVLFKPNKEFYYDENTDIIHFGDIKIK